MRVLVSGATGFVGQNVVRALLAHGHEVRALTHRATLPDALRTLDRVTHAKGDVLDPASLEPACADIDAVIHLVGIIREYPARDITFAKLHLDATRNMVAATAAAGIRRYLHMSALGTRPNAISGYHQSKWQAEELVRASDLDWTIFRPSLIYGPGDGFTTTMIPLAKGPFFPVIGGGLTTAQPVAIADVAEGFARALDLESTIGHLYDIAGPDTFTYRALYRAITEALGRTFRPLPVPSWAVAPVAALLQYQPWFPLTLTQLQMLKEHNIGDQTTFPATFDITMTRLPTGLSILHP